MEKRIVVVSGADIPLQNLATVSVTAWPIEAKRVLIERSQLLIERSMRLLRP
jgi:hypothetical protein